MRTFIIMTEKILDAIKDIPINKLINNTGQLYESYGIPENPRRINKNEFLYINASPLTKPSNVRPVFVASSSGYKVYGDAELITGVTCNYIKRPATVEWAGQLVDGTKLQNSAASVDFELHPSEETELVIKILELAGISTRELQVYQIAAQEEMRNTQQEKS